MGRLLELVGCVWLSALVGCSTGDQLFSGTPSASTTATGGAAGANAAAGASGGGGEAGSGGSTSSAPLQCSSAPEPTDTCAPACDSCVAGECRFQCDGDNGSDCRGQTIQCPDGMTCTVGCVNGGCEGTTVNCAGEFQCNVVCTGDDSCRDANIQCVPGAVCKLSCNAGDDVCRDTTVRCDSNLCFAVCAPSVNPLPNVDCSGANGCNCNGC